VRYGSVCSGIEAATVAWHSLGWTPAWFSEIDAFPCALLAHHYPSVPNLGDMTTIRGRADVGAIDLLVGGTPCQSFSVAGLRKGLDDPRGNLALVFLGIADALRPRWVVWENVPGVLSSAGGRDFGTFLGGLAELGYGFAYRVLDAQYVRVESHARAVPQRRRRVFVVGHLGDWRRAASVLLERESLCGHPAPSRSKGEGTAADAAPSLVSSGRGVERAGDTRGQDPVVAVPGVSMCLNAGGMGRIDAESETLVAHSLKAEGHDASEDGTGRGTPLVFDPLQDTNCGPGGKGWRDDGSAFTLEARTKAQAVAHSGVRRLTPRECERLQGFPDNYTLIPYRGKPAADSNRYKALGNSMAVNVMTWIGQRIAMSPD
jgi:DNA (cytosine-5)-methyltransferase 1